MGRILRRQFLIATGALLAARPADAQQSPRRIGWLTIDASGNARDQAYRTLLPDFLQRLGYSEGSSFVIERRYADAKPERLPALANELVGLQVGLIVTMGNDATRAARQATRTIPIVMAGSTLTVENGLIDSFARPGGNVTGLDWWPAPELAERQLQILKSAMPRAKRAVRLNDSTVKVAHLFGKEHVLRIASKLGLSLQIVEMAGPGELAGALERIATLKPDLLYVSGTDVTRPHYREIAEFTTKRRIISMGGIGYTAAGGLLVHSADFPHMIDRLASYIDRILRGANPADLPVEQPTKYELVLNSKTAKTMGLSLPSSFMLQVHRIVE